MKLHYLKYFCVLAEELHFHRAADRLAISQPPLSAAIKSLEDELGVQLMRRNSKMVELTRAGHAFLSEARAILERVGRAGDLVRALGQGMQGRLLVGISGSLLYREVSSIIADFQAIRPMVEVVLHELSAVEQIDKLTHGQLDVAFIHGFKAPPKLQSISLQNDVIVLCLPERHPLATRSEIDLRDVAEENFVMFSREAAPSNHDNVIAIFSNAGVHPRTVHMARTWMTIISTVAKVGGVALVPKSLENAQVAGVRYVPLSTAAPVSPAMLVWNPEASSAELEVFLDCATRITGATRLAAQ